MLFNYKRRPKKWSYKTTKSGNAGTAITRSLNSIEAIVIHNVGEENGRISTAKNNLDYFATGNTRTAGAHIFIDRDGKAGKSVWLKNIAWAVGKVGYAEGSYYKHVNNENSVSIELCGIMNSYPTEKQLKKLDEVVTWIAKKCPNIKWIVRHYDVVKKDCPAIYVTNKKEWVLLQCRLLEALNKGRKGR